MAEASDMLGILRQNLIDAGCDDEAAARCLAYAQGNRWDMLITELARHKSALLRAVHEGQRQIDCLDYLVYQLNKQHQQEEKT